MLPHAHHYIGRVNIVSNQWGVCACLSGAWLSLVAASQASLVSGAFPCASRYCISQHPEVEARIADELSSCGLLAKPGQLAPRAVAHDDLAKLAYLNRVIKAGARASVSGTMLARACVLCNTTFLPLLIFFHQLFPYMDEAVQEAMRMYPVAASGTARQTEQNMVMNGYFIPAGTVLVVPLYPLLNSPHVWDCPAEFHPVRLFILTPSMS